MEDEKFLIHLLPSNRWGGVERYAFDICRHFHKAGWKVSVVTRGARAVDTLFEKEGLSLLHAPLWGIFDYSTVSLLYKEIKNNPHSDIIVHAHGFRNAFCAFMAKKLSGRNDIKIVVTRHKVKKGTDIWIFRKFYRHIDDLIFVSKVSKERFLASWHGKTLPFGTNTKFHLLPYSINEPNIDVLEKEKKGPLVGMFHGPLRHGKGLETLIDSLVLVKGLKLRIRIVGSGRPDYVDKLRRRAMSRGVMEMIDWHRHTDDPLPFISSCDFGILPSSIEEAFGVSNIEYMACGRPQISTSNGTEEFYITDGAEGLLIPPGNPKALAEAIKKLADNEEIRKKMGNRARKKFNEVLSWSHFATKLTSIYRGK